MIIRKYLPAIEEKLKNFPVVGLLGARQIGKTTLAQKIASKRPSIYLDLENYRDLAKLNDPISYFELHQDKLIILDEIQRKPEIFATLRSVVDSRRRQSRNHKANGQFLILGSASLSLLQQSSESLAGRVSYLEMNPISALEFTKSTPLLWLRGGFPDSLLARSHAASMDWRQSFIKTYLERDILQFSPKLPSETLRRLWTMLAHDQGAPINAAKLAGNLGISGQTVARYVDLLTDLFLIRRLKPWHKNAGKRLTRSPKVYVRDSGILHALLNIENSEELLSHSIVGASWEGFVIDNLLSFLPNNCEAYFYRTAVGAEIDLVIKHCDKRLIAIEIKLSSEPKLQRGFYEACKDIKPTHRYVVYNGNEKFSMGDGIYAIGLLGLIKEISTIKK